MEKDRLKSILAGMGIASLVAGMAVVPFNAQGASGWGGHEGAGSTPKKEAGKSGWGGKSGAGSAETPKETGTATKPSTEDKQPAESKPDEKPAKKPGSSGWGGSTGAGSAK